MLVHVFKCPQSGLHGLAADPAGAALPRDVCGGAWRHVRDLRIEPGEQRIALDSDLAIAEIQERGYHLLAGGYQRL